MKRAIQETLIGLGIVIALVTAALGIIWVCWMYWKDIIIIASMVGFLIICRDIGKAFHHVL